ncbi:MAG: metallophosphoesterase [Gemmataceae bacterium]|nr:metallophosphoesterase [Gemmataceae bacterium]
MPASLPALTRRGFLASVAAGVVTVRPAPAADLDPNRVALLSDCHVGETPAVVSRECNMHDRLKQVAAELTKLDPRPVCAVVNGDLAYQTGTAAEYATFGKLVEPVGANGTSVHLGLGNHDHFGRFAAGLDSLRPKVKPVDGRQVLLVELPRVDLVVLDSYDPTNPVGGLLGGEQRKWLAAALDARKNRPVVVFAHHNLQFTPDKAGTYNGLADSSALWPLLKDRPEVKAYVFGHTHTWRLGERDGIHLINLPAVGYPFAKAEVTGWVDAAFTATGVTLEVHALDPKHAKHGDKATLTWRK